MKLFVLLAVIIVLSKASNDAAQSRMRETISKLPKYIKPTDPARVIGGAPTIPHSRKYLVALLVTVWEDTYFCGGTLISTKFVLTAAHCVDQASAATVILGAYNIFEYEESQVRISVNKDSIRIHAKWNWENLVNDIAIIALPEQVQLNEFIQLVHLPGFSEENTSFALKNATIVGWGMTSDSSTTLASVLQEANAIVMWNFVCAIKYKKINAPPIVDSHVCTSGRDGTNSCYGDSGGPLLIGNKQIGVVSWGHFDCEAAWPSVYTRITSYLLWIQANTDIIINSL